MRACVRLCALGDLLGEARTLVLEIERDGHSSPFLSIRMHLSGLHSAVMVTQ